MEKVLMTGLSLFLNDLHRDVFSLSLSFPFLPSLSPLSQDPELKVTHLEPLFSLIIHIVGAP